jgi:hypothetical protein
MSFVGEKTAAYNSGRWLADEPESETRGVATPVVGDSRRDLADGYVPWHERAHERAECTMPTTVKSSGAGYVDLDRTLAETYGGEGYTWFTPDAKLADETRGLFAGVRAYLVKWPSLHWHYVSFGFSDLGEKNSPDPQRSGWGFELTCRVPAAPECASVAEPKAPEWPFSVPETCGARGTS